MDGSPPAKSLMNSWAFSREREPTAATLWTTSCTSRLVEKCRAAVDSGIQGFRQATCEQRLFHTSLDQSRYPAKMGVSKLLLNCWSSIHNGTCTKQLAILPVEIIPQRNSRDCTADIREMSSRETNGWDFIVSFADDILSGKLDKLL